MHLRHALVCLLCLLPFAVVADPTPREDLAPTSPPMELGAALNDQGVYELLNSGGAQAGYVFETEPMAPCPASPARRSMHW